MHQLTAHSKHYWSWCYQWSALLNRHYTIRAFRMSINLPNTGKVDNYKESMLIQRTPGSCNHHTSCLYREQWLIRQYCHAHTTITTFHTSTCSPWADSCEKGSSCSSSLATLPLALGCLVDSRSTLRRFGAVVGSMCRDDCAEKRY